MTAMARERRDSLLPALVAAAALHAMVFAAYFYLLPKDDPGALTIASVPVTIVSDVPASAPTDLPGPPAETPAEMAPAEEPPVEAAPPPPAPTPPVPTPPKPVTPKPSPTPAKPAPSRASRTPQTLDLDALSDSLKNAKARRPARSNTPQTTHAAEPPGGSANRGPISSTGKVALGALTRHLQENWLLACESGADKVVARIRFRLSSTGELIDGPDILDRQSSTIWQAAAERAQRAVRASAPFTDLPDELLNREIIIKFNGEQACRGR